jgi:TDG/mug DNA glycosylase family protein
LKLPAAGPPARRPTPDEVRAAFGKTLPDVIAPGLSVLFCGINPGLYTAAVGHHFARPGNRFWPAIHAAGFTERLFAPHDERHLLPLGYGITNVVGRATAAADEISVDELRAGGEVLVAKVRRMRPRFLAILGIGAYRSAFARPKAVLGLQDTPVGATRVWVLPNPSGLNAHYDAAGLGRLFGALQQASRSGPRMPRGK